MTSVARFFGKQTEIAFKKGETIIEAGADPSGVFYLQKGFVRQYSISDEGQELTLHFFKPGSFFPLFWAVNNEPNRYFYESFNATETFLAPKEQFLTFLKNEPEILFDLTSRLLYGLHGLLTRVEYLISADAKHRVFGTLLFLAKHFGQKTDGKVFLTEKFTHQDIARIAGTTRETVSRELEKLNGEGIISQRRQQLIIVKDSDLPAQ